MRAVFMLSVIAVVGFVNRVGAGEASDEAIHGPKLVVLATAKDLISARKEATRAADRLGYAVAVDTLQKPPARRVFVGRVVALHLGRDGRFLVSSFLGDESDARRALKEGQKFYAGARMVPVVLPKRASDDPEEWIEAPFYRLGVVVVGGYKSYGSAVRAAQAFSKKSGYPYGSRGMVYDGKRGLIWPDNGDDEAWAGAYAPRRYDNECDVTRPAGSCITVERSEAYEGFEPGLYIVVAGIVGREDDKASRLAIARRFVPDAYVKQSTIYLGCTH